MPSVSDRSSWAAACAGDAEADEHRRLRSNAGARYLRPLDRSARAREARPTARYSASPTDPSAFTRRFDRAYTATAGLYDFAVRHLPVWRRWLDHALPHLRGPRVLEISFGTGYLLSRYAHGVEAHGVELNRRMIGIARRNVAGADAHAVLVRANVERLPYRDACFDSIVSTMAFSGYPDAHRALGEMTRVLRPGGRLVLIDVGHPRDRGHLGSAMVALWKAGGDLIRDMTPLFQMHGLDHTDEEIGGWGSVHLYVATKPMALEASSRDEDREEPDPPERVRASVARAEGLLREAPGA